MKDILVICYSFPPNVGVGGRRWAKFAKCLAKNNYRVHVISNLNKSPKVSEWINDVNDVNILNHPQNVFYPEVFISNPSTIFQKITYRFWLLFFKLFSKGTFYDRSFFWSKTIQKNVKEIIVKNNIKNIIVTGPPFRLLYFAAKLKEDLPDINLIADFRDPWTDNTSFLGFDSLSENRMNFEKKMEAFVIRNANYVISANDYLTEIFKKKYPQATAKFSTIINGYDKDELPLNVAHKNNESNSELNFVLAGTLYSDLEYVVKPFLNYLKNFETTNTFFSKKLNFHFYGQIDSKIEKLIRACPLKSIQIHGFQPLAIVKEKLSNADFCFLFTTPNHASNFNTKFYEYISMKKPIVHFSNDGDISKFLVENNLGFPVRPSSFNDDFNIILHKISTDTLNFNTLYDSSAFEVSHLTNEVQKLLV